MRYRAGALTHERARTARANTPAEPWALSRPVQARGCQLTRASEPGEKSGRPGGVLGVAGRNQSASRAAAIAWCRRAFWWVSLQVDAGAAPAPAPLRGCSSSSLSQAVPRPSAGSRRSPQGSLRLPNPLLSRRPIKNAVLLLRAHPPDPKAAPRNRGRVERLGKERV